MPILVTGATGIVGRSLISQLLATGHAVRAISRGGGRPLPEEVEVVSGDFTTGELPEGTFGGVKGVFIFPAQGGVDAFVAQARLNGVEQFVVLSSLAAALEHERDFGSISATHHLGIEAAVKASGADWTVLRPGTFANNLLAWAQQIRAGDTVYGPYPQSAQAPIHEADIAAVAAAALTQPGHNGKTYALTGPQVLTRVAQLDTIGEALGRKLKFQEIPPEAFRQAVSKFMPEPIIKMLLDYWSDTVTQPDIVRSTVEDVIGRKGLTLAEWARAHNADFS